MADALDEDDDPGGRILLESLTDDLGDFDIDEVPALADPSR